VSEAAAYFRKIHLEEYARNENVHGEFYERNAGYMQAAACSLHAGRRRLDARRTQPCVQLVGHYWNRPKTLFELAVVENLVCLTLVF